MAERLLTPIEQYSAWEYGAQPTPGISVVAAESITIVAPNMRRPHGEKLLEIVQRLANGTLTLNEIAAIVPCSYTAVRMAVTILRSRGEAVEIKHSYVGPPRNNRIVELADGTRTAKEIAHLTGSSVGYVYRLVHEARKGGLPAHLLGGRTSRVAGQ